MFNSCQTFNKYIRWVFFQIQSIFDSSPIFNKCVKWLFINVGFFSNIYQKLCTFNEYFSAIFKTCEDCLSHFAMGGFLSSYLSDVHVQQRVVWVMSVTFSLSVGGLHFLFLIIVRYEFIRFIYYPLTMFPSLPLVNHVNCSILCIIWLFWPQMKK